MTVLITGASRGIGAATAKVFAEHGFAVAVNFKNNEEAAASVVDEIIKKGGVAKSYRADVADPAQVAEMVRSAEADLGPVDVLVNNAGVCVSGLMQDMTDADYDFITDTNVRGAFNTCRAVLPSMISRKGGAIVNVSSMWGETGASCEVLYSMTKSALIGLTKALAKEVGPSGIRVNCVAPGVIDTDMNSGYSEQTMNELKEETPLSAIGSPEDVAKSIYFLCNECSGFVTGQVLGVNGGLVI
ncbi:MAG: 3-oxoacyl-ACP reductase FabG [Clostridia bacterium]|nr:3-oxoacyl-ACP reductase FabG [Clostridia bacterium]